MNDAKELQEIYTLLTENYVEDDDPEGLPGCGQLWWTRVNFGGLYHPIWDVFRGKLSKKNREHDSYDGGIIKTHV